MTDGLGPPGGVQTSIQASTLEGGHWFDIHISKTASERTDKATLVEVLNSLALQPK